MDNPPGAKHPKLLTIDDSPFIGQIIEEVMRGEKVELFIARNGEDGLAIARREQPQLIFLDLEMPRLSGIAVCRMLRAFPETAGATIYILSSRGMGPSEEEVSSLRISGCLTKPFSPAKLHELIRSELGLRESPGAGE